MSAKKAFENSGKAGIVKNTDFWCILRKNVEDGNWYTHFMISAVKTKKSL